MKGSRIALLGFGTENRALARFLHTQGFEFAVCDRGDPGAFASLQTAWRHCVDRWHLGPQYLASVAEFDWIFRTPGINALRPELEEARRGGTRISSQTQLFFDLCPAAITGITGTKGKGTTAALAADILRRTAGDRIRLGGNIGLPPIGFLEHVSPGDQVILELSSFQLHDLGTSPHIAVVLAIGRDHLDYHADIAEYVDAKSSICRFQDPQDRVVADLDNPAAQSLARLSPAEKVSFSMTDEVPTGAWLAADTLWMRDGGDKLALCRRSDLLLRGDHNLNNCLAAAATALTMGSSAEAIAESLRSFSGLPHRLQQIGVRNGVAYIDDSAATTPEAAAAAVRSFAQPLVLIAGGSGKGSDFAALAAAVAAGNVKAVVLMGAEADSIARALKTTAESSPLTIERGDSMASAVAAAESHSRPGDVILLSPGCASFGLFASYIDRAAQFRACADLECVGRGTPTDAS